MADRYWVGGTGNWDASTTTHWSASSGGGGGSSVPTSSDNVIFDSSSNATAYTVTVTATANCLNLTIEAPLSGILTFAGSSALNVYGNYSIAGANVTRTHSGTLTFRATSGTKTITTNEVTLSNMTFNGSGGTFQLAGNLTLSGGAGGVFIRTAGTFNANSKTVTLIGAGPFISGFTLSSSLYNLSIIPTTPSKTASLNLSSSLTISNVFTIDLGATVTNRCLVTSNTVGVQRIITSASNSFNNVDFMDIRGAGAGDWNLSTITGLSGDCGGNSGITFTTGVTCLFDNVNGGNWSDVANWTNDGTDRVPLPQDDVSLATSFGTSKTITSDMPRLGKSIDWTGATWTTQLTWAMSTTTSIFGSLTMINSLTMSGTSLYTFQGRGGFTFTSNALTFDRSITLNAPTGTLTLIGDLTLGTTRTLNVTNGTLSAVNGDNNYVISAGGITSTNFNNQTKTISFGSATHLITGTIGIGFGIYIAINPSTGTLKFTNTSNTAIPFQAQGKIYNNVWFDRGSSTGSITISGSNTFNEFKDTGTAAHSLLFTTGTTQYISVWSVSGSSGNLISINSTTTGTHTLTKVGGQNVSSDYLNIQHSISTPDNTWYAGESSTNNQATATAGSGWIFSEEDGIYHDQLNITENVSVEVINERYWVGGTANWDGTAGSKWAATSGGAGGESVPTFHDNVYFDANSGSETITQASGISSKNIDFTGFAGTFILDGDLGNWDLSIYGNITLGSGMTLNGQNAPMIYTYRDCNITSNGKTFPCAFGFSGGNKTINLLDDLIASAEIFLDYSSFNANNFNITTPYFSRSYSNYTQTILMGSGLWTLNGAGYAFNVIPTNLTLDKGTSTLKFTGNSSSNITISGGGLIYNNLWIATTGTGYFVLTGGNTFNNFKVNAGRSLVFADGTTTTISSIDAIGTFDNMILFRDASLTGWSISDTSGTNIVQYCEIRRCSAVGGATWICESGIDGGGNNGWNFINEINIYDSINITDVPTILNTNLGDINIFDSINITENFVNSGQLIISVYDSINITDIRTISNTDLGDIAIFDSINITENFVNLLQLYAVVYDSINITDIRTTENQNLGNINIYDSINITENFVDSGQLSILVSDQINITDVRTTENQNLGNIYIYDSITITEFPDTRKEFTIVVNDFINISENLISMFPFYLLETNDNLSINESQVIYFSLGDIIIYDLITITETILIEEINNINTYDGIYLLDEVQNTIKLDSSINEYDYIDIIESITISTNVLSINVLDSINILENLTEVRNLALYIYDVIGITDNSSGDLNFNLSVNDLILISENNEAEWLLSINSYENVIISESTLLESFRISKSIKRPIGRSHSIGRPIGSTNSI